MKTNMKQNKVLTYLIIMRTIKISLLVTALILNTSVFAGTPGKVEKTKKEAVAFVNKLAFWNKDNSIEKANKTLENATKTLKNIMESSSQRIPETLLNDMEGIVIIPRAFKVAMVWGGQGGRGIAMVRDENGEWSNPVFVNLGEGSVGFQAGAEFSDIVLLFKDGDDILKLENAELTLGADISLVAGPVSSNASVITDAKFDSDILSYTYSKGLFAGISLKGGILKSNDKINEAYYEKENIDLSEIFFETDTSDKNELSEFLHTLNQ